MAKEKVVVGEATEEFPNVNVPVFPPLTDEEELSEKSYSTLEDESGTSGGVGAVPQGESDVTGKE